MKNEKSALMCIVTPAGRAYSLEGLRKLAAALCEVDKKRVDDRERRCKVSPTEGIIRQNE